MKNFHLILITVSLLPLMDAQCEEGVESGHGREDSLKLYLEKGGLSKCGEIIVFQHDDVSFISQSQWKNNPNDFFDSGKLKLVAILGGEVTERIVQFFSLCENIEAFEIGGVDEGVFLTPDAAKLFPGFRNLKYLFVSIYNPDEELLEHIANIKTLEGLELFKACFLNLSPDRRAFYQTSYLTDDSIDRLTPSASIKSIRILGGGEDPIAKISIESLASLLSMRSLESLEINKYCFDRSDWPTVLKLMPTTLKLK